MMTLDRRVLRLYVNALTETVFDPSTNATVQSVTITKRDNFELQVALTDTNTVAPLQPGGYPVAGTEVDISGCTFKFGLKTIQQYQLEGTYAMFTQTTNPLSTWQDLTKGRLSILFEPDIQASSNVVKYRAELEIKTATDKVVTVFLLDITIIQDLNIGGEGPPTPSSPTYYTAVDVDALLDDRSRQSGIYIAQYPFPLINGMIFDEGEYFEKSTEVFHLTGFVQVPSVGADIKVRMLQEGVPIGDELVILQGEQYGDILLSTPVIFDTTSRLGAIITQIGSNLDYPGQNLRFRLHHRRNTA